MLVRLVHLSLTNFRNYARLEWDVPASNILLVGDNAQGKSNLLEAIAFLATARSFRAATERELIHWLAFQGGKDEAVPRPEAAFHPYAHLAAWVEKKTGSLKAEISLVLEPRRKVGGPPAFSEESLMPALCALAGSAEAKQIAPGFPSPQPGESRPPNVPSLEVSKRLRLNGVPKRAADYIGQIQVVSFSPDDLELISGSPMLRRRYLDVLLAQLDPRYYRALSRYNKVLLARNRLLRCIAARQDGPLQLAYWNDELVTNGSYITAERARTVQALNELAGDIHKTLTGAGERLQIVYRPCIPTEAQDLVAWYREALQRLYQREVEQGVSLLGPHRDDVAFLVNGMDMRTYGSRAQQRTIALSLKLAEMALVRSRIGEEPLLLLDDIMSELDSARRRWVLAFVASSQQAIITATEIGRFTQEFLAKTAVYRIADGTISVCR